MGESSPHLRSRLGWLASKSGPQVPSALEPLIRALGTKSVDKSRILHALEVADHCHEDQTRKSGEPYITHPAAIATILVELGMDEGMIIGTFLHDTVEDTDYQLPDLRREFGSAIKVLVDGVTKLDKVEYGEAAQAEIVRKMVIAMSKDIRIPLVKSTNRLRNVCTWKYVSAKGARHEARETFETYTPLAYRLGMNSIKWELEDRSSKVLYLTVYNEIERLVTDRTPRREAYILQVRDILESELKNTRVKRTVTGRSEHYYPIYQKMILRGKDFEDIYDLMGVCVLVGMIAGCYAALDAADTAFIPIQGRIKDYIAIPKFGFHQSAHMTVIGPDGRAMEVQIRTYDTRKWVEYGVATH